MNTTPLRCALCASLLWLLAGCAAVHPDAAPSSRTVKVEAINRMADPSSAVSYLIRSSTEQERSLRFREVARHVRKALAGRGLFEAPPNVVPDLLIEIEYGMVDTGVKQEIVTMPVYSQVASAMPEIVGYRAIAYPIAHHDKYLTIVAHIRDASSGERRGTVAWRVQASIQDEAEDLRGCLPLLAAAVMEQLARDTAGTEEMTLANSDPLVAFIRSDP